MRHEQEYPQVAYRRREKQVWDAQRIKALREYLKLTQREMADELQVRQQTISEWENAIHTPHRSIQKMLSMVAESAGFAYTVAPHTSDAAEMPHEPEHA